MDCAVPHDGGLRALASTSPEVDAADGAAFERIANGEDLRVAWERCLQI